MADVTTRTCVNCHGEGSFIHYEPDFHQVNPVLSFRCPKPPTAIGEEREPGRCAQLRCPCCDGMGMLIIRPFANQRS